MLGVNLFGKILSEGGGIDYTINGTRYRYGAWFSIGDRNASYFVLHLMVVAASGWKLFIALQTGTTFNPDTATWREL